MPKRKTADANLETPVKAETANKRSTTAAKSSTSAAATHKRTASKKADQPSAVGNADPVAIVPAAETVSETTTPTAKSSQPNREQIAVLAYSYWEQRGYQSGSADEDWLRAERELASVG